MMTGNFLNKQMAHKHCEEAGRANSPMVPLCHMWQVLYRQPGFDHRGGHLSSQHCPLPTSTAVLLISPVDTVQLLVADPAELDASAVLMALELCRAHCTGGKHVGIRQTRCEVIRSEAT